MSFSLALGGGGAKGLAHIEFLKVFDEFGFKPKQIAATSIGAVIGALYASGKSASEIEKIALSLNKRTVMAFTDFTFNNKAIVKGKKIHDWLDKELNNLTFRELSIPLKIVTTNLSTGKVEIITEGKVADAVRASIAIPGIFEPVKNNGNFFVDGGVLNQVPYDLLKGKVIAIDVTSKAKIPEKLSAYENLMYSFYTMRKHLDERKKKPAMLIELSLPSIALLDFHKYSEVKKIVSPEIEVFKKKFVKLIN